MGCTIQACQHCQLFDALQIGIILLDGDGRISAWNPWLSKHSPLGSVEVLGKTLGELVPGFENSRFARAIDQARKFGLSSLLTPGLHPALLPLYQNSLDRKHDRRMHQLIHVAPAPSAGGCCMIQIQDMTASVQREQRMRHNESKLRGLYELSPLGIALTDMEGRYVEFNEAFQRITGYSEQELKDLDYWTLTPKDYEAREAEQIALLSQTGRYGPYEKEYVRKDGSRVPLQLNGMLVTGLDGQNYIWSIVEDITERKRIDRMKSEFVSTVSHELRTPLTSIAGALGLLNGGALGSIPEPVKPWLDIACKNSQRLIHLINDLLDMEKIVAGKMHFDLQVQPLMPLVEQALEANKGYGDSFGVRFVLSQRVDAAGVNVDSQRLMQVLSNFLSTSAKFSPRGAEVEVAVREGDRRVRVEVADHGPGIPAEFRQRIFQKFSQADSSDSRQKGGTGLGLAITKELVERMGGQVGFVSEAGQGATFFVELPSV
jgi:PAS domain S-box-containing protein